MAPSIQPMSALLAARMDELRLLERIAVDTGERILSDRLATALAATEDLVRPSMPDGFPEAKLRAYARPTELVRMHRLCKLVADGDRVVDIGVGGGYVLAALFANIDIEYVFGVDITDKLLEQAGHVAAHNGLEDRVALQKLDVTQMPEDWLQDKNADLLLMFEVLEHVSSPADALSSLAAAMTDELLVFSVPIQGRIEACWGHRHAFDSDAVVQLIENAGLHLQYCEALYNTWAIFAVSAHETPHPLVDRVAAQSAFVGDGMHVTMKPVPGARVSNGDAGQELVSALNVEVEVDGVSSYVEFDTPNMALFRMEFMIDEVKDVERVWLDALGRDGELICSWEVVDIDHLSIKRSYPFRPGWPNRICRPTVAGPLRRIQRVQLHIRSQGPRRVAIPRVANGTLPGRQLEPFVA